MKRRLLLLAIAIAVLTGAASASATIPSPRPGTVDVRAGYRIAGPDGTISEANQTGTQAASVSDPAGRTFAVALDPAAATLGASARSVSSGTSFEQEDGSAVVNDTITLSEPATVTIAGELADSELYSKDNDSRAAIDVRIAFTGDDCPDTGDGLICGEYREGNAARNDATNLDRTFSRFVDLPAGTTNVNALLQVSAHSTTFGGSGEARARATLRFHVEVPAGVDSTSGSGLLSILTQTVGPPPSVSIADTSKTEGDSGTSNAVFTVSLSATRAQDVSVHYATEELTATEGVDYESAAGELVVPAGQLAATIAVPVLGDTTVEPDETFLVTLSDPTNATLGQEQGIGTIVDDDSAPPPAGACILVEPETEVDFGTAPFSTAAAVVTRSGPNVTVTSCAEGAEQVSVRGTDATGTSGAWTLSGATSNPCAAGTNVFGLALGDVQLAPTSKPWASLAASQAKSAAPVLTMPCTGSSATGQTLRTRIVFTATT